MPALRMFGRKWLFATDDLVFPSIFEIPYRALWLVLMSVLLQKEYEATWYCNDPSDGEYIRFFLFGTLALQVALIPALVALAHNSAKGTITDTRKFVVPILLYILFMMIPELALNITGTIWIYSRIIQCSLSNSFSNGTIHTMVILTWIRTIIVLLSLYLFYDPLGSIDYEDLQTPAKQGWYNRKLMKTFSSRLKWALWLFRGDEHSKEAIQEIARLLTGLFRSTDLVQSDIVAGCILLRIRQKRLTRQAQNDCEEHYCTDMNKAFETMPPWMNIHDAFHYMNLSMAAYGWMYVMYRSILTGLCSIAPFIRCCCCRPSEPEIVGDNCCICNYAGLKYISKVEDKDILYVSFTNKVFEVPFYVITDHERKTVVIIIRGTMSVPDVFTDLAGTCDPLDVEGCPTGTRVHRGMAMGASKTMQNVLPILEKAFQVYPDYNLVVTGHSLGAAISILLGIKLKPKYQHVKVYAFSAPSGLLSREAASYTESFVMTVGVGDDVVMRLGVLSAEGFRDRLVQVLNATRLPKYRILLKGLRYAFTRIPECDLDSVWKCPEDLEAQLLNTPVMPRAFPETDRLYNAGRILHISRHKPTNRKPHKQEFKYKMAWTTPDNYKELLVMPRMLIDHLPESVHAALKTIIDDNRTHNQAIEIAVISQ